MVVLCSKNLLKVACSFLAAIAALAAPAAADPVELRIEVYGFAGFHVLTNRTSVTASGDRYSIATDLDTRGLASVFVDLTSHSEVRGRLAQDAARPDTYHGEVRRNGSDSRYRIDYRADGTVASDQSPPSPALRSAAAADQMRGTVDQLTAFFILERQLAQRGSCGLVVPVFDGLSRYNLRFTDAQPETLSPEGRQHFAGPTLVCNIRREDVVGFPGGQDANGGTYKQGKIWYARLTGQDQMVPVRMEFDTEYGSVSGYLTELRSRGVNLSLKD
jgi:Protein of unknown function (DUF3108)